MARGGPEIVLLPGLDGTGELFDRVAGFLAGDFMVTIARYPQDPNLGYAGYVDLVRKEVGKRSVYILGESFSGPVAVLVAAQLGAQVLGVVLAATFVRNPWPGWLIRGAARMNPEKMPVRLRDALLMGKYGDAELAKKVDEIIRGLPRPVRAARLRAVAEVDVRREFAELRCPILVLHGRGDWLVPMSLMQKAVGLKGGARMIVLPAAHMLLQTRAAEAAGEIVYFTRSPIESQYEA
jgi:pimeloyl-ACP methyl ester carboxylesterase